MSNSGEHNVFVTLGATNHSTNEREQDDYYATDPIAMELLLNEEQFDHNIWECACGGGHLSKVLEERGYNVTSTDLIDRGYGKSGVDFLKCRDFFNGDIITNPPYKFATEFVEHALELIPEGNKVAMFLRLQFLEGQARRKLFRTNPPLTVYVASKRINCCKNGNFSKEQRNANSALAYVWIIWQKGHTGATQLKWFN